MCIRDRCISVHVPQLECDSPDAACINDELNAIYAADFREYEAYEEAGQPGGEYPQIGVCLLYTSSNRVAADDNPMKLMSIAMKPLCAPPFPLDYIEEMTALMGGDGRMR